MLDKHARDIPKLDGLVCQGKCAGDHGLRSDDGRQCRECDHRQQCPARREQIKWIAHRLRVFQDQGTLAKIIEYQSWQYQNEPGAGNGFATEVPHVCIQCFGARQREHHCPEDGHTDSRMSDEKMRSPVWIERLQHFRPL
ncbi:hypothetical protein D9M71_299280 [compost metagenome]